MENSAQEEVNFGNIRQSIRRVFLSLVQAISDENPLDEVQFCADYFNDLIEKKKSDLGNNNHHFQNCVGESRQAKEGNTEYQDKSLKSKDIPTNVQGSSSAPLLAAGKQSESVNLRGTSSWDTPSKVTEPIRSLAVLEDVACGIGDQPSTNENKMAIEKDIKAGDVDTSLEHGSFEGKKTVNKVVKYSAAEEYLKSCHSCNEYTEEDIKTLCTHFENMRTSNKQLSPNSSFGFVPQLHESDSEKDTRKTDSENSHVENLKRESSMIAREISEILQEEYDSENEMDKVWSQIGKLGKFARDFQREKCPYEGKLDYTDFGNDVESKYDNSEQFEPQIVFEKMPRNMRSYIKSEEKTGEDAKTIFIESIDSQQEESPDRENPEIAVFDTKDDHGETDEFEPQIVFENIPINMSVYFKSENNENTDEKRDFTELTDSQQEKLSDEDKPETSFYKNNSEIHQNEPNQSKSQVAAQTPWRRKLFESYPSVHKSENLGSKEKNGENTETDFTHPMDFQQETYPDKENLENMVFRNAAEDDHDKSERYECQKVAHKSFKRKWYESDRNMPRNCDSLETRVEDSFAEAIDTQQAQFTHVQKSETIFPGRDAEDDRVKTNSQVVVNKTVRKTWHAPRLSLDNLSGSQRRDPRLNRTLYPAPRSNNEQIGDIIPRHSVEEIGDVPPDRFSIPKSYMNGRSRNQITSESSRGVTESNYSGSSSNEIRHRSNSARSSHNLPDNKTLGENASNFNNQNTPHSWTKLCRQSHSSEILSDFLKLNEVNKSYDSAREIGMPVLNEEETASETEINISEEKHFEASDKIHDETNFGIKEPTEDTLNQCEDNIENISVQFTNDQHVMIHDTQEALSEIDLPAGLNGNSQTIPHNQNIDFCDKSVAEEDKRKQCTFESIEMKKKYLDQNVVSTDAQEEKAISQHTGIFMKCGFDASCGDFMSSRNDANEQDDEYQITVMDPEDDNRNRSQQYNESSGMIPMEQCEEVFEEQKDAHEDLNASFWSESDSIYIEVESGDSSEADDFGMQDK